MTALPQAAKLVELFEALDDGHTGKLPTNLVKSFLCEVGDGLKPEEWKTLADDMDVDGMCNYKWYFENILCNSEGIGHWKNWLKE
ncbi:hypothetical protein DIPPA_10898 [Diplonema papillatum]|nr:hypothetical protein DIPPA_10898 [Diplonema papillatum]|eukprot:gene22611-34600_t